MRPPTFVTAKAAARMRMSETIAPNIKNVLSRPQRAARGRYARGSLQISPEQRLDALALLEEPGVRRSHAQAGDDLIVAVPHRHGVGIDDARGDAVAAIGGHRHADPVIRRGAVEPGM